MSYNILKPEFGKTISGKLRLRLLKYKKQKRLAEALDREIEAFSLLSKEEQLEQIDMIEAAKLMRKDRSEQRTETEKWQRNQTQRRYRERKFLRMLEIYGAREFFPDYKTKEPRKVVRVFAIKIKPRA